MIAIYGLFIGDHCHYVGQTKNPEKRKAQHAYATMAGRGEFELRIFRWVEKADADKEEQAEIKAWTDRGMAELNGAKGKGLLNVRIPQDLEARIVRFCDESGMGMSEVVRGFLSFGMRGLDEGDYCFLNGRFVQTPESLITR